MYAELRRKLAEGLPRVIGMDILFDLPSSRGAADDEALGAAVAAAGNVVLGAAIADDIQPFYTRRTLNPPISVIRRGAAGIAPLHIPADADNQVRRLPLQAALGAEH